MEAKLNEPKLEEPTAEHAEYEAWFKRKVQEGLEAARAGRLIAASEVEARAAAWRAQTLHKLAAQNALPHEEKNATFASFSPGPALSYGKKT